jgi:hypothetical protein
MVFLRDNYSYLLFPIRLFYQQTNGFSADLYKWTTRNLLKLELSTEQCANYTKT